MKIVECPYKRPNAVFTAEVSLPTGERMPELRTDSNFIPAYNHIMDASESKMNDDIEAFSTLHDVSLPDLSHSPLPLQCLAAEALPDNVKQEIEELTNSSVEEYRQSSNEKQQHEKQQQTTGTVATGKQVKEYTVTVPLQFFTNGHGLRIVGGVDCQHTGERHAQIVCLKFAQEINEKNTEGGINRRPELLASLHNGLCVLELEGHSLRGASFEDVRRIMKTIRSAVVKLVVKDCKGLSNHLVSTGSDKGMLPKGKPEQPPILTMRRQHRIKHIPQRKHGIISSTSNECQTGNTRSPEHKQMTKKISTQSFDSTTSLGSEISMSSLLEEFCSNLPTGMAKLALRYSKSQETLHINLHKLKGQSKSNPKEQSSAFLNTYLFPDKRSQGVKYCKLVPAKASTDDLLENSANYFLTEDELSDLSLRIVIWESGNAIRSKKPQFKGEVFLNISDTEIVNLHGVPQWYPMFQPDRNLPVLPKPYQIQQQGTLIKKMKASWANTTQTIGVMTLRRMMKGENNLGTLRSQSLQDISKQDPKEKIKTLRKLTNFPAVLEPLKEGNVSNSLSESRLPSRSSNRGSILSVFELGMTDKEKEELSLIQPLSQDPPSPFSDRRMSIYEFLEALNTEMVDSENSSKNEAPNTKHSNSFHNDITAKPDSIKSSSSSGGELRYRRMSLLSFLASLDRPNSQVSQTGSEFSQESSLTCSSDCSSISSVCAFKNGHLKGWSEEKQSEQPSESDSSTLSLSNSTQHSIIVSNPIEKCHSFVDSLELDPLLSLSPDSPSDEIFKPIATKMSTPVKKSSNDRLPLISINDEPPHRAASIHSSTETLISQQPVDTSSEFEAMTRIRSVSLDTPTRQGENSFDNSQKSNLSLRLSKSADDLTDLMEEDSQIKNCGVTESTLDVAEYQRNPLDSSDAGSSSLDRSVPKSHPTHNQKRTLHVFPSSTHVLESISEHKQISNDKFVNIKSGKKPSKSLGHKWLSMDNLLQSASSEKGATKKVHKGQQKKRDNIGTIRRLVHTYETGKPVGSVHLQLTAKYVAGEFSVKVLDIVFFSNKLMNTDFVVNVSLYNRFSEESEISKKGLMAIRKNGMFESKEIPPMFEFSGNPSVYFVQMTFQTGSRIFGHRSYYTMIDIKETIAKSDAIMWFQLSKLS